MIGKDCSMMISTKYKYNKYIIALAKYLVIITIVYAHASCKDPYKFLYGSWKIYKNIRLNGMTSLTTIESKHLVEYLINKQIILAKDYIILDGVRYKDPIYKIKEKDANEYLWNYYRIPDDKTVLGIHEDTCKIKIVKIRLAGLNKLERIKIDWEGGGSLLYFDGLIYYNNELILNYEIEFFNLKKL